MNSTQTYMYSNSQDNEGAKESANGVPNKNRDPFDDEPEDDPNYEPEWHTCMVCGGSGEDFTGIHCPVCRGKGEVLR